MTNYCVDINREYQKAKSKLFRFSLLFSLLLTGVIVGDVLLVLLDSEEYTLNFIIASVITVVFIWFAIWFITTIYGELNARYKYFKGYQSGLQPVDEIIIVHKSDELTFVNGLYVYPLLVKYVTNLGETNKIIYTMDELDFDNDDKLTVTTYQRILIKAEKHV